MTIKKRLLSYIKRQLKHMHNMYWDLLMQFWKVRPSNMGTEQLNKDFSIGIVTYVDRYQRFFKPLITNLVKIFPDTEFVIAVNGYYDKNIQHRYLAEIKAFLSQFRNVKVIDFVEPQSLSKLWNLCVVHSTNPKTMILNDDIKIKTTFRIELEASGALQQDIALINRSWSHFIISKKIIAKIGWFDERFPGVGNEDEDYEARLCVQSLAVETYRIHALKNIVFVTLNFSYGKNVDTVNTKYLRKNKIFFDRKWEMSVDEKPGFVYVPIIRRYIRLNPGMETPLFYEIQKNL